MWIHYFHTTTSLNLRLWILKFQKGQAPDIQIHKSQIDREHLKKNRALLYTSGARVLL